MLRIASGIRRLLKELFFDGKGTLSLIRVFIAMVLVGLFVWQALAIAWVYYITVNDKMESGSMLAQAVLGSIAQILSAQVLVAAFGYFVHYKFGPGGISAAQLDALSNDPNNPGGI